MVGDGGVEMTEVTEQCPLCTTAIPPGAVVCRGCGANKRLNGARVLVLLVLGGAYIVFGPVLVIVGLNALEHDKGAAAVIAFGAAVAVIGFFPLWFVAKMAAEPMWYRHIA